MTWASQYFTGLQILRTYVPTSVRTVGSARLRTACGGILMNNIKLRQMMMNDGGDSNVINKNDNNPL
jgi:hypothetical protein